MCHVCDPVLDLNLFPAALVHFSCRVTNQDTVNQERQLMSCDHGQELSQYPDSLLAARERVTNQEPSQLIDPTFDFD